MLNVSNQRKMMVRYQMQALYQLNDMILLKREAKLGRKAFSTLKT